MRPADPPEGALAGWRRLGRKLALPLQVLLETVRNTLSDGWIHAGNIAYLSLVALLPLMILIAAVAAAVGQTEAGYEAIGAALSALPQHIADLFRPVIEEVLEARVGNLLWVGALVALWTVTTFIETLRDVIRRAFRVEADRGYLGSRLRSIAGLLVAVILATLMFVSQVVLGLLLAGIRQALPYNVDVPGWVDWSRIATPVSLFLILWALFRLLSPRSMRQYACWPGALLITWVWVVSVQVAFPLMATFGGMGLTYGALSGVMLALLFFYIIGFSLVAGAELNAAIARATGCGGLQASSTGGAASNSS